jgi:hypothetical protein
MVSLFELPQGATIMDSCFGAGAFLDALTAKQLSGYFTPEGGIAICLGVPTILVMGMVFIIKKLV